MTTQADRIYLTFNYPGAVEGSKTLLSGIRKDREGGGTLYITGFYEPPAGTTGQTGTCFLYKGDVRGDLHPGNTWNIFSYPSAPGRTVTLTNFYGPDILHRGNVRVVGAYKTVETGDAFLGCMYEGPLDGSGAWTTIVPPSATNTILHSTSGRLVVGNYQTTTPQGRASIYDVKKKTYFEIIKPGASFITAYGIWQDCGPYYTIAGGFSDVGPGTEKGYLVTWNNETHELSDWREYQYQNSDKSIVTHFDGITSDGCGGYNLTGEAVEIGGRILAFFAHVGAGRKKGASWEEIKFPGSIITSGNSIANRDIVGVYSEPGSSTTNGYLSIIV
jgi:hypothetical protein